MSSAGGARACGNLIDDMEAATGRICAGAGRVGAWYAFNDDTGMQWPSKAAPGTPIQTSRLPTPRGQSWRAMHTYGLSFSAWGGGIGFDLSFDGVRYGCYDASRYSGIRFWLRGAADTSVGFRVNAQSNTAMQRGGRDSLTLPLGPEWVEYVVPFDELSSPSELDRLASVQFKVSGRAFDFWVDDVSFSEGPPNCCSPLLACADGARFESPALRSMVPQGDRNALTLGCSDVCSARSLSGTQRSLGDLRGVECLSQLNSISLTQSGLRDVSGLKGLMALNRIELSGNALEDIGALSGLANLSQLDLSENRVSNLTALSELHSLRSLMLAGNAISDLTPLRGLKDLQKLVVAKNSISNLEPLAELSALTELDLSQNSIVDVSPLVSLWSLSQLDLRGNRALDCGSQAALLRALRDRGVRLSSDCP